MPTKVQERVSKGLCPRCGEEAAPYRLCFACRQKDRLTRALKRGAKSGMFIGEKDARGQWLWKVGDPSKHDRRWETTVVPKETDRRFLPRMRGAPVDVEAEVVRLLQSVGLPMDVDDIVEAWGRLRADGKRKHGSVAADIRAIILAKRRREQRAVRRVILDSPIVIAARAGD